MERKSPYVKSYSESGLVTNVISLSNPYLHNRGISRRVIRGNAITVFNVIEDGFIEERKVKSYKLRSGKKNVVKIGSRFTGEPKVTYKR